jgi:protein-S-isoprenylcysteine O-methyltransferase Ste14
VGQAIRQTSVALLSTNRFETNRLADFQRTKIYDVGVAIPFLALILYRLPQLWALIRGGIHRVASGNASWFELLVFTGRISSLAFALLILYLLFARRTPQRKSEGLLPRIVAIIGSFTVLAFVLLDHVRLTFPEQLLATLLSVSGTIGSVFAAAHLGKSFSILPEARKLVTSGPYAVVRHPLYLAETLGILGSTLQYRQPEALMLGLTAIALLYWRTVFEEQVLTKAYPEYSAYAKRTWRFIPYVC